MFHTVVFTVGGQTGFLVLLTLFELVPVGPTVLDRVVF